MGEVDSYLTPEVMALIGCESEAVEAWDPVEPGAVRRFTQAIMDADPIYWDEAHASETRYGGVVAPPLYPAFTFRRRPGTPDPLDRFAQERDWDGITGSASGGGSGLPPVSLSLPRLLNGGVEAEFYQFARPGERVRACSRYVDFSERQSRGGHMVFIVTETTYTNEDDEVLLILRSTIIRR